MRSGREFFQRAFTGRLVMVFILLVGFALGRGWSQTGLTLRGEAVTGESGHDITMIFRTDGFWQITQGMGTIQWNPAVIDFVSAGDFGIPAINSGTFTRIPEGKLSFDWSSSSVLGNTLSDGAILFSLTFNLRGAPGASTTVAFTDGWTSLHFESAESINLPFSSVSGTASIVPEPSVLALLALAGGAGLWMRRRRGDLQTSVFGNLKGSSVGSLHSRP